MKNSIDNERIAIRKSLCTVERILRRITEKNNEPSPNSGLGLSEFKSIKSVQSSQSRKLKAREGSSAPH